MDPGDVLDRWFSLDHMDERDDERVRRELGPAYHRARRGKFVDWDKTDHGRLALILLFDQVPRHLFRGKPEQYQTDHRAQELASVFFDRGFPDDFAALEVYFAALPYLHAEDPDKQDEAHPVITECARRIDRLSYMGPVADEYREIIHRFGRFPHRNECLGRESTPEEEEFLNRG